MALEPVDDLTLALEAARKAGDLAMTFFGKEQKVWSKGAQGPVSEADYAVDQLLRQTLTAARPDYGWLSEETADNLDRLDRNRVWTVDPIDGTRAFLRGGSDFCISVALVEDGEPVVGVLYQPTEKRMIHAHKGSGAFAGDAALSMSDAPDLPGCIMAGNPDLFHAKRFWPTPWPDMTIRQMNSIALRIGLVATGDMTACVALRPKHDWDLAAADLIVREAGGVVINEHRQRLVFNQPAPIHPNVIAGPEMLIGPMLERIDPALAAYRATADAKNA